MPGWQKNTSPRQQLPPSKVQHIAVSKDVTTRSTKPTKEVTRGIIKEPTEEIKKSQYETMVLDTNLFGTCEGADMSKDRNGILNSLSKAQDSMRIYPKSKKEVYSIDRDDPHNFGRLLQAYEEDLRTMDDGIVQISLMRIFSMVKAP